MAFNAEELKVTQIELDTQGNYGMPDIPGLSTSQMQRKLDQLASYIATEKLNALIDKLNDPLFGVASTDDLEQAIIDIKKIISDLVLDVGAGDMATLIYDTELKRIDVYKYVDISVGTAMTDASIAMSMAGNAQTAAVNAQTTADNAQITADNAMPISGGTFTGIAVADSADSDIPRIINAQVQSTGGVPVSTSWLRFRR